MTALAGIWRFDSKPDADACCTRMLAAQSIYGPHGAAVWSGDSAALGRGLFRLLPEDIHDNDLQLGAGGNLVMAADVRLDNRDELIAALGIAPDRARISCDAAVLMAAFVRWGEEVVDRLSGDFAFAVWNRARRRLFLARDFMGSRPLHFHRGAGFFAFASMPKGLHALPDIPYAVDEERAAEFLALLPEGGRSFFAGIERVQAGHVATVTLDAVSLRRYWQPQREALRLKGKADYAEALRHHMDEAVRVRLRRIGPSLGAHLSGGLDSATVASTAARLLAPSGGRVTAFTAVPRPGYDGPVPEGRIGDEGPLAAATAAMHPNIDHVLIHNGASPLDRLDRNFQVFEQPMLNLCNSWLHAIADEARARGISVMLIGQMGNMTLSYNGIESLAEMFASGRWLALVREGRALVRNGYMGWRGVASCAVSPHLPASLWRLLKRLLGKSPGLDIRIYSAIKTARLQELDLAGIAASRGLDFSYQPRNDGFEMRLWVLRRVDLGNYNKGVLGGWGIDQRDPTADRRLVEFCLAVPTEQFLANGVPRSLAKRALADRLPQAVLQERRKGYQAVDWHEGLTGARAAAAEELERLEACGPAQTALDLPRMRRLVEDWPSSGWEKSEIVRSHRLALLRGLSAGHFLRKATRSNR